MRQLGGVVAKRVRQKKVTRIRVFVALPSDVTEERHLLGKVVEELNRGMGSELDVTLELVRWETHASPDMGRPQEIINRQVGPYDIFIGMMWRRFGTPTGVADSGTQEEFESAFLSWKTTGQPRIMFYFNQAPYTLQTSVEVDQVRRVLEFRDQIPGLYWQYTSANEFEDRAREHLTKAVREILAPKKAAVISGGATAASRVHHVIVEWSLRRRSPGKQAPTAVGWWHGSHARPPHRKARALPCERGRTAAPARSTILWCTPASREPVQELFDTAYAEWRKHHAFASRDRLELFRENRDKLQLTREQLRFLLESWFKTGIYSPEDYVNVYDQHAVDIICEGILQKENAQVTQEADFALTMRTRVDA